MEIEMKTNETSTKARFKEGDRVRVTRPMAMTVNWVEPMARHMNEVFTVKEVVSDGYFFVEPQHGHHERIKMTGNWWWADDCLELENAVVQAPEEPKLPIEKPTEPHKYATENAQFLSDYPTRVDQIRYYTQKAVEHFDHKRIEDDYSYSGVETNVEAWYDSKLHLFEAFRNHPLWNEEAKAVITSVAIEYKPRYVDFDNYFRRLVEYNAQSSNSPLMQNTAYREGAANCRSILTRYVKCGVTTITKDFIDGDASTPIMNGMGVELKAGQKVTRAINAWLKKLGAHGTPFANSENHFMKCHHGVPMDFHGHTVKANYVYGIYDRYPFVSGDEVNRMGIEKRLQMYVKVGSSWSAREVSEEVREGVRAIHYNKVFAQMCDAMVAKTVTQPYVISFNFMDFLTVSNGNSWSSCHALDRSYRAGVLSYANDESSAVTYVLSKEYTGNEWWAEPKVNRQMYHFDQNGDCFLQSRLYPNDNADDIYEPLRHIVQKAQSVAYARANAWQISRKSRECIYTHDDALGYKDYEEGYNSVFSSRKGADRAKMRITIGAQGYCIYSGDDLQDSDSLNCNSGMTKCYNCGNRIDEDDAIYINDEYYCTDCLSYCDHCNEYVLPGDIVEDSSICETCYRDDYFTCDHCGSIWHNEDSCFVDGEDTYVCPDCLTEYYFQCEECSRVYTNDDRHDRLTHMCESCGDEATENADEEGAE